MSSESIWCYLIMWSSATLFSFCLQSFPASGSFPMSQLFASGGQSTGVSASASVLPVNIQDWFPLGWTGWISLLSKGLTRVFSNTTVQKHQFFSTHCPQGPTLTSISHTAGKTIALTVWIFVGKAMSLLSNMLSRLVRAFLPRSKCLWTSWLQSLPTVIMEPQKIKSVPASTFPPSICHEVMGLEAMILVFWMLSFKPALPPSSFSLIKKLFHSSSLCAVRAVSLCVSLITYTYTDTYIASLMHHFSVYLRLLIFLPAILIPAHGSSSPAFRMMYSA